MPVPVSVCNGTAAAGSSSLQVTVGAGAGAPQGIPAGYLSYVAFGLNVSSNAVSTVTNSQGDTYLLAASNVVNADPSWLYATLTSHPLVPGTDWIKVTCTGVTGAKALIARGCPGVTSAAADKTASAQAGIGSPASGATAGLSQDYELAVGVITSASTGGAPTGPSFGSLLTLNPANFLSVFDAIVNSGAGVSASATITSATWSALAATFRLNAAGLLAAFPP